MPLFGFHFGGAGRRDESPSSRYEFSSTTAATVAPGDTGTSSVYLQDGETRAAAVSAPMTPTDDNGNGGAYPHVPYSEEYTVRPTEGRSIMPRLVWGGTTPTVILKLRKRLYPLAITRLTAGMDVNVSTGAVAFKWAWTDRILGGRLSVEKGTLALTKRIQVPDLRASVDIRAAFDCYTRRTLFSLAVLPLPGVVGAAVGNGVALRQRVPIEKRVDVEMFARVMLPEARFSSNQHGSFSLGDGDFVLHLDQLNLRIMLQ